MYSRSALGIAAALLLVACAAHGDQAPNCATAEIGRLKGREENSEYLLPGGRGKFIVPIPTPWECDNKLGVSVTVCDRQHAHIAVELKNTEEAVVTRGDCACIEVNALITVYCQPEKDDD